MEITTWKFRFGIIPFGENLLLLGSLLECALLALEVSVDPDTDTYWVELASVKPMLLRRFSFIFFNI